MTMFSKNLGGMASLSPPGYAYGGNADKEPGAVIQEVTL